jgi:uncharacterized protein (DUF2141 family)
MPTLRAETMQQILASLLAGNLAVAGAIPSTPDLGTAEGRCRANESGPSYIVDVAGLKARVGKLKLEVYPANNADFLQDDNRLVSAGKTFRRVEQSVPASGPVQLCVRVPSAGSYSVSLLHDQDGDGRFDWKVDGVGFAANPKLGLSKPDASKASAVAGSGPTRIEIVMRYRRGLGMHPIR